MTANKSCDQLGSHAFGPIINKLLPLLFHVPRSLSFAKAVVIDYLAVWICTIVTENADR